MRKFIWFVFFIPCLLAASKYSDFVDALYYEKIGDYKKSFEIVNNITKIDKDPYLYKYLYMISVRAGMNNRSGDIASKIVEVDSTTADNWIIYGNSLAGEGKREEAYKAYKKAVELDPENIDAYYQLAVLSSDNIFESEKYFKKIIEIDPSFKADAYYNIGVLYSMKKDEKKTKEYMELAIKADQYNLKPYYFMATYYDEKGEWDNAIKWYERLFSVEPTAEVANRIAEIYLSQKKYQLAENYFSKTLEINPLNSKALWWLSLLAEERKDYASAKKYLLRIKGWDEDVDAVLKMSYFDIMMGDLKSAVEILRNANKKWPDNNEIAYYLALGLMDEGKKENDKEIKKLFELVVSTNPNNYEAKYNLAVVCERLNEIDCFEKNFRELLVKNPNDHSVLNYLGYSLIDRGIKLDEAIEMVEKAVSLDKENSAYLDSLAWGYYKKGDYEKALSYMEKSVSLISKYNRENDPLIYEHYADILLKLSRYQDAYQNYKISVINGAKNSEQINLKVFSFLDKLDPYYLFSDSVLNYPEFKNTSNFNLEFNAEYRKFLKKKNIKFTFNGFFVSIPKEKYISFKVLGPLFTPILEIEMNKNKYNFNSEIGDERISDSDIERYSVLMSFIFRWYSQALYYWDFKKEIKSVKRENGCFYYSDIFKKGDKLKLCMDKNPFAFDLIYYESDINMKIRFSDFRPTKQDYSDFLNYYMPYSAEFEFPKALIRLKSEEIKIEYGK
ncbi:MAG: tetratricopeptide repeat protein [Elusimicrobiales bacterium]|nr:tetratricopeptide repeat protein [Elusimicrobiales bacterium]